MTNHQYFLTGIGTDIGKTIVSAILVEHFNAEYWKPIQAGNLDFTDSDNWINTEEDSEMLSSRIQDIQARIGEFTAKLQSEQAKFNKENAIYQATVQTALQDMQVAAQVAQQETTIPNHPTIMKHTHINS